MTVQLPRLFRFSALLLGGCLALLASGCARDQAPKVLGSAYIRGEKVPVRDQLGPSSVLAGSLEGGERVDVLAKRARWVRVRLAGGGTGWVQAKFLVAPKLFDQFQ